MKNFNQVPIRTVLHALGVATSSEQSQHIQCLNPMHNDKTASAYINEHTIHCFGCNTTYNAMGIIKVVLNVDDENARDWYSRNVLHDEVPTNNHTPRRRLPSFKPHNYGEVLTTYLRSINTQDNAQVVAQYVESRGLKLAKGLLFYAGQQPSQNWLKPLTHRIIIPYYDLNKRLYCLQGRSIDGSEPKYIYHKMYGDTTIFYGLEVLNERLTSLYIAEGALTALAVRAAIKFDTYATAIATPSLNHKLKYFLEVLKKYPNINKVIFVPDAHVDDGLLSLAKTGYAAFSKLAYELKQHYKKMKVHIVQPDYSQGKDALDVLANHGLEALKQLLANKQEVFLEVGDNTSIVHFDDVKKLQLISDEALLITFLEDILVYETKVAFTGNDLNPIYEEFCNAKFNILASEWLCSREGYAITFKAWLVFCKVAFSKAGYKITDDLIARVLEDPNFKKVLLYNPYSCLLESEFQYDIEQLEHSLEYTPLIPLLAKFPLTNHAKAERVIHLWLRLQYLVVYKSTNFDLKELNIYNGLMLFFWGSQGSGKSTLARLLGYLDETTVYVANIENTSELITLAEGKTVVILDEFSLAKADITLMKRWLTSFQITLRKKYQAQATAVYRTDSVIAISNHSNILRDETGERRMFPIQFEGSLDLPSIDFEELEQVDRPRIASFYYQLNLYNIEVYGGVKRYFTALNDEFKALFVEATKEGYFIANTNLPEHIQMLDDYLEAAELFHIQGHKKVRAQLWTSDNDLFTSLRHKRLDSFFVCKEEFVDFLRGSNYMGTSFDMKLAKDAFSDRIEKWGYLQTSSKVIKYKPIYGDNGIPRTARCYSYTETKLEEIQKKRAEYEAHFCLEHEDDEENT